MPESVSGVDAILAGLREASVGVLVGLASAEAAVHAAADARTGSVVLTEREVTAIKSAIVLYRGIEQEWTELAGTREGEAASDVLAALLARRFPNGGTPEGEAPA